MPCPPFRRGFLCTKSTQIHTRRLLGRFESHQMGNQLGEPKHHVETPSATSGPQVRFKDVMCRLCDTTTNLFVVWLASGKLRSRKASISKHRAHEEFLQWKASPKTERVQARSEEKEVHFCIVLIHNSKQQFICGNTICSQISHNQTVFASVRLRHTLLLKPLPQKTPSYRFTKKFCLAANAKDHKHQTDGGMNSTRWSMLQITTKLSSSTHRLCLVQLTGRLSPCSSTFRLWKGHFGAPKWWTRRHGRSEKSWTKNQYTPTHSCPLGWTLDREWW